VDGKGTTNRCRFCGTALRFDFLLAALSLGEALRPFINHALSCPKFPPEHRKRWEAHARRFLAKMN
jgi:hypothetical protein